METLLIAATKILGLKYVKASPQRVLQFKHGLDSSLENKKLLTFLETKTYKLIKTIPQGELRLYDSVAALITHDNEFPIQFCFFFSEKIFNSSVAAVEEYLVTLPGCKGIKIDGLPLSAYTLFKVLIPKFKIVIGGEKHTAAGEAWNKRQVKEALKDNLHIYLSNEHGALFKVETYEEVKKREDLLWGSSAEYKSRRVIMTTEKL